MTKGPKVELVREKNIFRREAGIPLTGKRAEFAKLASGFAKLTEKMTKDEQAIAATAIELSRETPIKFAIAVVDMAERSGLGLTPDGEMVQFGFDVEGALDGKFTLSIGKWDEENGGVLKDGAA